MGIIFLALVANGNLSADADIPTWVVVSAATAIALGTYFGGWRIVRTMGSRIIKMDPAQGFAAQGAGAAVILSASHVGFPLSTTQVMSGAIMGAGAAKRLVRGALGRGRATSSPAWILTLPCSAAVGALTYGVVRDLRRPARSGPIVVVVGAAARAAGVLRAPPVHGAGARGERAMRLGRRRGRADLRGDLGLAGGGRRDHRRASRSSCSGSARYAEARRTGRGGAALAYGALARRCSCALFAAAIVLARRRSCSRRTLTAGRELLAGYSIVFSTGRARRRRSRTAAGRW